MDSVDKIFNYYEEIGKKDPEFHKRHIEHMIHSAMLAEKNDEHPEIILAVLFQDIGKLFAFDNEQIGNNCINTPQKLGSDFLRDLGIPEIIPELVESIGNTNKYLAIDPNYLNRLKYNGAKFNNDEAREYEKHHNFHKYIKIKKYVDNAPVIEKQLKSIQYYKDLLINYLFEL